MDSPLCDTSLTGHEIYHLIRDAGVLKLDGHQLVSVEAANAIENQGSTAALLRVSLKWSPETDRSDLPKSVVIKVLKLDMIAENFKMMAKEDLENLISNVSQAHQIECAVYGLKGLDKVVRIPKCYAATVGGNGKPGVIIMEDLGQGVVIPQKDFGLGVNDAQFEQILDAVSSVHAWSVNTDFDWKKSLPAAVDCRGLTGTAGTLRSFYDGAAAAYPKIFEKIDKQKFDQLVSTEKCKEIYGGNPREKYGLPLVLVHGDVHTMNMIWESKNGKPGDRMSALIDWQISHQGCGAEDLVKAIGLCLSKESRRAKKDAALARYVELFNSKVTNPKNHIQLPNLRKAFDAMFSFMGVSTISVLSIQDTFLAKNKYESEEEKEQVLKRIREHTIARYEDSAKILGW